MEDLLAIRTRNDRSHCVGNAEAGFLKVRTVPKVRAEILNLNYQY